MPGGEHSQRETMTTYNVQRTEERLREEIIRVCRLVYQKGYVAATDGNVSARLNDQYILATPSGFSKGFIEAGELIVVDMDGRQVDDYRHRAQRGLRVTSEILLHLEVYRQRPDVQAVVHAHPPITVALSIAGIPIARCLLPEVLLSLGSIPTTEYATPSSPEGPIAIQPYIGRHDAIVLQRHGSVTVGKSPLDAYLKLEKVEHSAEITMILKQLGVDAPIPPGEAVKLIEMRQQSGRDARTELCTECDACEVAPAASTQAAGAPIIDQEALVQLITQRVLKALK
jgi:L-fuculose-phosphate aldolase